MSKKMIGPLYVTLGAVLWSFAGICIKFIPWHPLSIACVRGTVGAITIALAGRRVKPVLNKTTLLAGFSMFVTAILFMFANKLTSAANAIVLQYTAPVYVLIAVSLVTKTRLKALDLWTVLFTIIGIVLFFVEHLGDGALVGDGLSLLSGVTFAAVFFLNSRPSANPQDAAFLGCGMAVFLLPMLLTDPQVPAGGVVPWIAVLFLGVVQLGLGYFFFAKGVQQTGAVAAVVISAAEPILNPFWVFLFMGERPGILSLLGGVIVVVTICVYNLLNARRTAITASDSPGEGAGMSA